MKPQNRLRELDFLRGMAIILVLFRHQEVSVFTTRMGWIGVDLFFVLSGFLVSGLLFREYLKYGDIKPARFLIRRGFKIYPIYYLTYPIYFIPKFYNGRLDFTGFVADMTFLQNYIWGWGYAYSASWSLAIEEHFYFGLSLFLWLAFKNNWIKLKVAADSKQLSQMEILIPCIMLFCLGLRFMSNTLYPFEMAKNTTMTHLRIDSLLAGVLVSYLYHFRLDYLKSFYEKYKYPSFILAAVLLTFTHFLEAVTSFFVKTIGFTCLYISFSIILINFLLNERINDKLNGLFTKPVVSLISRIGFCSYSIYIIHTAVNKIHFSNDYLTFLVTTTLSVLCGIIMTDYIEGFFLNIRDKYYPNRRASMERQQIERHTHNTQLTTDSKN